ncbi:unnamed protein product [Nyctereutes procyonoides]|uniref:(raccoon dog) hypothetical protein n=1 Tax=Nyctereutes procyonoides TaxID=34880 RepID=A0A811ZLJ0_NYCPR|nr:unnamed protein product [Nyctereutes procyonoides]
MCAFYVFFLPYCNRQKFQHNFCINLVRVDIFTLFLILRREHSFFYYYVSFSFFTDFLFQREREAETQAEGEVGSMLGARRGTRSQDSRIAPWAKGRRQTAEPPRDPPIFFFNVW